MLRLALLPYLIISFVLLVCTFYQVIFFRRVRFYFSSSVLSSLYVVLVFLWLDKFCQVRSAGAFLLPSVLGCVPLLLGLLSSVCGG